MNQPSVNLSPVVGNHLASANLRFSFGNERLDTLDDFNNIACLQVSEQGLGVSNNLLAALVAGVDVGEVTFDTEAEEKTSNEFGVANNGVAGTAAVHFGVDGGDWANSDSEEIAEGFTSVEPLVGGGITLDGSDVVLNFLVVEGNVLGDSGGESCGVLEDGGPLFDGSEVFVHVFAGVKGLRDLESDESKLEGSLGVGVPSTVMDVLDTSLDFIFHDFTASVAVLNLEEMVVASHLIDEATEELRDGYELQSEVVLHLVLNIKL